MLSIAENSLEEDACVFVRYWRPTRGLFDGHTCEKCLVYYINCDE